MLVRAAISGLIGIPFGLAATYGIHLAYPSSDLRWGLIAVAFASFFAGVAGYISGAQQRPAA